MEPVRILVVGDAYVGKTTLIDVLCGEYDDIDHQSTRRQLTSSAENTTVGCYINVREHQLKRSRHNYNTTTTTNNNFTTTSSHHQASLLDNVSSHRRHRSEEDSSSSSSSSFSSSSAMSAASTNTTTTTTATCGIEFVEVGGSRQYSLTRSVLYDRVHAILLVHDLTNPKTMYTLAGTWLKELTIADQRKIRHGGISARHQLVHGVEGGSHELMYGGYGEEHSNSSSSSSSSSEQSKQRLSARDLSARQISLLQRIPVLIVGTKLDSLKPNKAAKCGTSKYDQEVMSVVYVNGAPPPAATASATSTKRACVVDTYGAASEAVSYRNQGSQIEPILRFIDQVCAADGGMRNETA